MYEVGIPIKYKAKCSTIPGKILRVLTYKEAAMNSEKIMKVIYKRKSERVIIK